MAGKKKNPRDLAKALNALVVDEIHTIEELSKILNCGEAITRAMADNFLTKIDGDNYARTSADPVHYNRISTVLDKLRARRNAANRRYRGITTVEEHRQPITEEFCINFLLKTGKYKILKARYEEITKPEES